MMLVEHAHAARVAQAAGRLLVELRSHGDLTDAELRAEGDRRSHELLLSLLTEAFPNDAILSEEGKDDPARLQAGRVWIVDPLDGTREYGEQGRSDWAVQLAFVQHGELVAGAVALPALDLVLSTAEPPALPAAYGGPPRMVVSRTRPPAITEKLRDALGAELVPMGSAGAKAMAVVRGEADVYAHGGGQYEWDSAGPVAVAAAAGLHVSRLDGSPLRYNQANPWLPDLLICRPELAEQVIAVTSAAA
jgi:3'(2'), 5'-bisphosphate nucleotidase